MKAQLVADSHCVCGEGPLWHPEEKKLYYVDIEHGALYRYDPASTSHEKLFEGPMLGGCTLQAEGSLLLFLAKGAIHHWKAGKSSTLVEDIPDERETRFNDVAADPKGRVFCGTMPTKKRPGRLYRFDPDQSLRIVLEGIGCSNGIGFTNDCKTMYYTDSTAKEIYAFDYDQDTGALSNKRLFAGIQEGGALPDGLTVDAEDHVWSALWDGHGVVRFDPKGREERRISVPCKKASSVLFGGEEYKDLYITTAGGAGKPEEEGSHAGGLFHCRPGIQGKADFRSKIKI